MPRLKQSYCPEVALSFKQPIMNGKITLTNSGIVPIVSKDGSTMRLYIPNKHTAIALREELDGLIDWMERTA